MTPSAAQLREVLLAPEEAAAMDAPGGTDAAVLIPLFPSPDGLTAVFTERRADLSRHAGEISFPGGREEPGDADLQATALRECCEEIGLAPGVVDVLGALPPVGTFVTSYRIFPFVGLVDAGQVWRPQETEVAEILELSLASLIAGHEMKRLIRKGVPIKTPTYTVDGHLVWGATARIVQLLLRRVQPLLERR